MAEPAGIPTDEQLDAVTGATDLSQVFRDLPEDEWLRANIAASPRVARALPTLPDEHTQRRFAGKAGDEALVEAHTLAKTFKNLYREYVGPMTESTCVLDYGCGWGRITRFFLNDIAAGNLWGIDCNADLIDFCRESNPWARFEVNDPLPPTDLDDDDFDLAFSYSVFTHLSEDAHLAWLDELRRVVKPGGYLMCVRGARVDVQRVRAARLCRGPGAVQAEPGRAASLRTRAGDCGGPGQQWATVSRSLVRRMRLRTCATTIASSSCPTTGKKSGTRSMGGATMNAR